MGVGSETQGQEKDREREARKREDCIGGAEV